MQQAIIKEYYNDLAGEYDKDRFDNTYGQYIDRQEKKIIRKLLNNNSKDKTLDLACGTGRFLEFAKYGVDISPQMLQEAHKKHPECELFEGSALQTPFKDALFETILSFHLIMHLDADTTSRFLKEAHRLLKQGGKLIFDFPSKDRRKLVNYKAKNWHAANDFTPHEIVSLCDGWILKRYYGILFFPIHRIPTSLRKPIIALDNMLCHSFLRRYASYQIVVLEKR